MKERVKNNMKAKCARNEQGGSKIYALVGIVGLFLLGHAAWNYVPAAYQIESFRSEIHNTILQVSASPHGTNEPLSDKLKKRLRIVANENGVPANALIEVSEAGNKLKAHVRYTRQIDLLPFGFYRYQYQFDNTTME